MSTGVYIRISSASQNSDSQKEEIQKWLHTHGYKPEEVKWFQDIATGKNTARKGFEELNKAIFAGEVKTVVVWRIDRISRNLQDGINTLCSWCDSGVRVVSVTQQIDLSGTFGRLIAGVLFALADIGLETMRENQRAGIAVAKTKGKYTGRKKGTTKANPAKARELKAKGLTISEIAKALGVSERTVSIYLKKT